MQSYVMKLAPGQVRAFSAMADLFVYESGVPVPGDGDTRICVKPDSGTEIVLRPGQRFRLAPGQTAQQWEVEALDPSVALSGYVIIGSGEFDDANTLNKVTLDATFANEVTVTNTTANRVPVSLDTNQLLQIAGQTVQYTNSFIDATTAAAVATPIFTAASNPNGAFIEFAEIAIASTQGAAQGVVTLLAKATAPANATDGDALMVVVATNGAAGVAININQILGQRIKIPAGKGLYLNQQANATLLDRCIKTVLYTLL